MKKTRIAAVLLLAAMLASATACGADTPASAEEKTLSDTGSVTQENTSVSEITEKKEAYYPYELRDMGGYEYRMLNVNEIWFMNVTLDTDGEVGETLADTMYRRNRSVEETLNCRIRVVNEDASDGTFDRLTKRVREEILSGEDNFDVMYPSVNSAPSMLTDGYFRDLHTVDGLHLDGDWWNQVTCRAAEMNGALYFAANMTHLMFLEGTWAVYFNEKLMTTLDLDKPYDLVRNGSWTLDAMLSYLKSAVSLNGDDDYTWDQNGKALYGIAAHPNCPEHFLVGAGEYFVVSDNSGSYCLAADTERFANAAAAVAALTDERAGFSKLSGSLPADGPTGGYRYLFMNERALFLTAEVKQALQLREMEDTFGIVPFPKYDEAQADYLSTPVNQCMYYTIPVTNTHLTETAHISDVLAYRSLIDVIPVYYGQTVEQKGLRNEDSIEMLDIIRRTSTIDVGQLYGWVTTLMNNIRNDFFVGNGAISSKVEKERSKIDANIEKTVEALMTLEK